jgi:uncharacterized membrane protein YqjE
LAGSIDDFKSKMAESESTSTGTFASFRKMGGIFAAVLQNRADLLAVELQEEKYRLVEVLILVGIALALGMMALFVFTGVIIFAVPETYRIWVACGLGVLYLVGIVGLWSRIKKLLANQPFPETINQIKRDWECLTPPK